MGEYQPSPSEKEDSEIFARVHGAVFDDAPSDLYVPPDALHVTLDSFEGPLDLLLYLIRAKNIDVLEISVSEVTSQYLQYIELMSSLKIELAAEYLLMAATLASIKSRMLLPRIDSDEEDEEDPRAELVRSLLEYERFKKRAHELDQLPRIDRDVFRAQAVAPTTESQPRVPNVDLRELALAFAGVMVRAELTRDLEVAAEPRSVRERMSDVMDRLSEDASFVPFTSLFIYEEGRDGIVVTLLALLELLHANLIGLLQRRAFEPIYVQSLQNTRQ